MKYIKLCGIQCWSMLKVSVLQYMKEREHLRGEYKTCPIMYFIMRRAKVHISIVHFRLVVPCHYKLIWAAEWKKTSNPDQPGCRHMAKAYLAVCSTDRKSNIGSYHNCERRSQLNSESTAGSIRKHFTVTLFSPPFKKLIGLGRHHATCQSLTKNNILQLVHSGRILVIIQ